MDWSTGWGAGEWNLGFQGDNPEPSLGAIGVEPLYPTAVQQNAVESYPGQYGPGDFGNLTPQRTPSLPAAGTYKGSGGYVYALRSDRSLQIAPGSPRGVGTVLAPGSQHYDNILNDLSANKWTPVSADPMETYDPFKPSEPKEKTNWLDAVRNVFKDVKPADIMAAIPPRTASPLLQVFPPIADQQRQTAAAALANRRMAVTLGLSALGILVVGTGVWLAVRSRA